MLPNEVFALECLARYAREGLVVDSSNGHFAHCPYPKPRGQKKRLASDLGYYLTFYDHQHQGLLQSVDVGRKCYFSPDVLKYLNTWPSGFFELCDIYDEFNKLSDEWKKARSGKNHPLYGKFGSLHPNSKAVRVIKPDGTELHFGGVLEAARELGIDPRNLPKYLKKGKVLKRGVLKGYQLFYAE